MIGQQTTSLIEDSAPPADRVEDPLRDRVEMTGWNLVHTATTAVWTGCLAIGIMGLVFHYPRPRLAARESPPIIAERVRVDLADDPTRIDSRSTPDAPVPQTPIPQPPAPAEAQTPSDAPPLTPVAIPNPAIAFALPDASPARTVDAKLAVPTRAPVAASPLPGTVHHLTYGVGEGAQPSPEYPRPAVIANQQGTVGVRFTVGTDGKVTSADISMASRWPMLNQAAVRVVRDRWRFSPGPVRYFDVSIQFELTEQ